MKTILIKTILISLMVLSGLGCVRPESEKSQVALQLPTYKNETALTCTKCLKAIIVNVNSENFKTIVFNQKMDKFSEAGSELTAEIVLDIPSGLARKIQILAIYLLPDTTTEIQYGSAVVDLLVAEPPPITIALASLGLFKGGSIVGRYLTVGDLGPTVNVIISVNHAATGMNMDVGMGEVVNGWFNMFASENFPMSYRFESGISIPELQNVTINDLVPLVGATAVNHRARIHRPSSYYVYRNTGWIQITENHDIVYGFFGPSAAVSSKKVCIEHQSAATVFTQLASTSSGSVKMTFDEGSDKTADVYGIGGLDSAFDAECILTDPAALYTKDVISITKNQFDGMGNDTAAAKGGAFSYVLDATHVRKFFMTGSAPAVYNFKALPGLFSGLATIGTFDGFKLFSKANAVNGGFDNFRCFPFWLETAGFTEVAVGSPTVISDLVRFSLPANPLTTDGFILCPTKGGLLTGLGGFYLGSLFVAP